jgi:sugar lactone lactonase YvrE
MFKKCLVLVIAVVMTLSVFPIMSIPAATDQQIEDAINAGVAFLAGKQLGDGSWGPFVGHGDCEAYTGFVLLKLQDRAYELNYNSPFDPAYSYSTHVISGWIYLFGQALTATLSLQDHTVGATGTIDNPDTNGNGYGIYWGGGHDTYKTGVCLMALVASGTPNRPNDAGIDFNGDMVVDTYREIAQDVVDYLAWAQGDLGNDEGGYGYGALDNAGGWTDNSNSGYAYLGLGAAEAVTAKLGATPFACTVPGWVKTELNVWIGTIQDPVNGDANDGGSYYNPDWLPGTPWCNELKAGNLIFEMTFYGDIPSVVRFDHALDYIERHWRDANQDPGWGYNIGVSNYQAMFCLMKGLVYSGITHIDTDGDNIRDDNWFNQEPPTVPAEDFASVIVAQQDMTTPGLIGSWPVCLHSDNGRILSTTWALLTLEAIAPPPPKVQCLYAGGSDPGYVYQYAGGTTWDIISPDLGYAVLDLVKYQGHLYAGTMSTSDPENGIGRVYRYDGGMSWTLVGDNMDDQVCALEVYNDNLYAGTAWGDMNLYRYNGGTSWTQVVNYVPWYGTRALHVSHDLLLMGDIGFDLFGHIDAAEVFTADHSGGGSCIYDYEDYNDHVYGSAYQGRLWESPDATSWNVILDYYDGNMWELEAFQGLLYMSYNNGELRASNIPDRGALIYTANDGIISMETDGDNLYFGTGGEAGAYYGSSTTGTASVYRYDGTNIVLISDPDYMVTGVQVLYVPELELLRYPIDDSYTDQRIPYRNYGTATTLWAYHKPAPMDRYMWLKFDLTCLSGYDITSATLHLHPRSSRASPHSCDPVFGVHYSADDSWDETTITWNNQPGFNAIPEDTVTNPVRCTPIEFDVTNIVKSEVAPGTQYISFVIKSEEHCYSDYLCAYSSEHPDESLRPYLEIT